MRAIWQNFKKGSRKRGRVIPLLALIMSFVMLMPITAEAAKTHWYRGTATVTVANTGQNWGWYDASTSDTINLGIDKLFQVTDANKNRWKSVNQIKITSDDWNMSMATKYTIEEEKLSGILSHSLGYEGFSLVYTSDEDIAYSDFNNLMSSITLYFDEEVAAKNGVNTEEVNLYLTLYTRMWNNKFSQIGSDAPNYWNYNCATRFYEFAEGTVDTESLEVGYENDPDELNEVNPADEYGGIATVNAQLTDLGSAETIQYGYQLRTATEAFTANTTMQQQGEITITDGETTLSDAEKQELLNKPLPIKITGFNADTTYYARIYYVTDGKRSAPTYSPEFSFSYSKPVISSFNVGNTSAIYTGYGTGASNASSYMDLTMSANFNDTNYDGETRDVPIRSVITIPGSENGTVTVTGLDTLKGSTPGTQYVIADAGTECTLTIKPEEDFDLGALIIGGVPVDKSEIPETETTGEYKYSFTLSGDATVTPVYRLSTAVTLTIPEVAGGTVTADVSDLVNVAPGTQTTLTVTPEFGFELKTLTVNGTVLTPANLTAGENGVYTYELEVTEDTIVTAVFDFPTTDGGDGGTTDGGESGGSTEGGGTTEGGEDGGTTEGGEDSGSTGSGSTDSGEDAEITDTEPATTKPVTGAYVRAEVFFTKNFNQVEDLLGNLTDSSTWDYYVWSQDFQLETTVDDTTEIQRIISGSTRFNLPQVDSSTCAYKLVVTDVYSGYRVTSYSMPFTVDSTGPNAPKVTSVKGDAEDMGVESETVVGGAGGKVEINLEGSVDYVTVDGEKFIGSGLQNYSYQLYYLTSDEGQELADRKPDGSKDSDLTYIFKELETYDEDTYGLSDVPVWTALPTTKTCISDPYQTENIPEDDAKYTATFNVAKDGYYRADIKASDNAGHNSEIVTVYFRVDLTPPNKPEIYLAQKTASSANSNPSLEPYNNLTYSSAQVWLLMHSAPMSGKTIADYEFSLDGGLSWISVNSVETQDKKAQGTTGYVQLWKSANSARVYADANCTTTKTFSYSYAVNLSELGADDYTTVICRAKDTLGNTSAATESLIIRTMLETPTPTGEMTHQDIEVAMAMGNTTMATDSVTASLKNKVALKINTAYYGSKSTEVSKIQNHLCTWGDSAATGACSDSNCPYTHTRIDGELVEYFTPAMVSVQGISSANAASERFTWTRYDHTFYNEFSTVGYLDDGDGTVTSKDVTQRNPTTLRGKGDAETSNEYYDSTNKIFTASVDRVTNLGQNTPATENASAITNTTEHYDEANSGQLLPYYQQNKVKPYYTWTETTINTVTSYLDKYCYDYAYGNAHIFTWGNTTTGDFQVSGSYDSYPNATYRYNGNQHRRIYTIMDLSGAASNASSVNLTTVQGTTGYTRLSKLANVGYYTMAFRDWLFLYNDQPTKKTIYFTIDDYHLVPHANDGYGFLFNTTIRQSLKDDDKHNLEAQDGSVSDGSWRISGYLFYVGNPWTDRSSRPTINSIYASYYPDVYHQGNTDHTEGDGARGYRWYIVKIDDVNMEHFSDGALRGAAGNGTSGFDKGEASLGAARSHDAGTVTSNARVEYNDDLARFVLYGADSKEGVNGNKWISLPLTTYPTTTYTDSNGVVVPLEKTGKSAPGIDYGVRQIAYHIADDVIKSVVWNSSGAKTTVKSVRNFAIVTEGDTTKIYCYNSGVSSATGTGSAYLTTDQLKARFAADIDRQSAITDYTKGYKLIDWEITDTETLTNMAKNTALYPTTTTSGVTKGNVIYTPRPTVDGVRIGSYKSRQDGYKVHTDSNCYGFGPLYSARSWSHACHAETRVVMSNIVMEMNEMRTLSQVVTEPQWGGASSKFILYISDESDSDFSDPIMASQIQWRLLNDEAKFIGWGGYDNGVITENFLERVDDEGTYIYNIENVQYDKTTGEPLRANNAAYKDANIPTMGTNFEAGWEVVGDVRAQNVQEEEIAEYITRQYYEALGYDITGTIGSNPVQDMVGNRLTEDGNDSLGNTDGTVLTFEEAKSLTFSVTPSEYATSSANPDFPQGRWYIVHDTNGYENSTSVGASGSTYKDKITAFYSDALDLTITEPGRYTVYFAPDAAKVESDTLDPSDSTCVFNFVVNTPPVAQFTGYLSGSTVKLTNLAYDPDNGSSTGTANPIKVSSATVETMALSDDEALVTASNPSLLLRATSTVADCISGVDSSKTQWRWMLLEQQVNADTGLNETVVVYDSTTRDTNDGVKDGWIYENWYNPNNKTLYELTGGKIAQNATLADNQVFTMYQRVTDYAAQRVLTSSGVHTYTTLAGSTSNVIQQNITSSSNEETTFAPQSAFSLSSPEIYNTAEGETAIVTLTRLSKQSQGKNKYTATWQYLNDDGEYVNLTKSGNDWKYGNTVVLDNTVLPTVDNQGNASGTWQLSLDAFNDLGKNSDGSKIVLRLVETMDGVKDQLGGAISNESARAITYKTDLKGPSGMSVTLKEVTTNEAGNDVVSDYQASTYLDVTGGKRHITVTVTGASDAEGRLDGYAYYFYDYDANGAIQYYQLISGKLEPRTTVAAAINRLSATSASDSHTFEITVDAMRSKPTYSANVAIFAYDNQTKQSTPTQANESAYTKIEGIKLSTSKPMPPEIDVTDMLGETVARISNLGGYDTATAEDADYQTDADGIAKGADKAYTNSTVTIAFTPKQNLYDRDTNGNYTLNTQSGQYTMYEDIYGAADLTGSATIVYSIYKSYNGDYDGGRETYTDANGNSVSIWQLHDEGEIPATQQLSLDAYTSYANGTNDAYKVVAQVKNGSGTLSDQRVVYFTIDKEKPTTPQISLVDNGRGGALYDPTEWASKVTATVRGSSDKHPLSSQYYLYNESTATWESLGGGLTEKSVLYDFNKNGENTVRVKSVDLAGNENEANALLVKIDTISPLVPAPKLTATSRSVTIYEDYIISVNASTGGTVEALITDTDGDGTPDTFTSLGTEYICDYEGTMQFKITPNEGYELTSASYDSANIVGSDFYDFSEVDEDEDGVVDYYLFTTPTVTADMTLAVTFTTSDPVEQASIYSISTAAATMSAVNSYRQSVLADSGTAEGDTANSEYTVTIDEAAMENGTLTYEIDSTGTSCTITAVPNEGYELDVLTVNGEAVPADAISDNKYAFELTENVEATATFKLSDSGSEPTEPETFTVTVAEGIENGTVTADVVDNLCTLTITPAEGYELETLTLNGSGVDISKVTNGTYEFELTESVTVIAAFKLSDSEPTEPETFTVTVAEGIENGTVTADVVDNLCTLTIAPAENYELETLTVGSDVINLAEVIDGKYAFTLTENVTVNATFKAVETAPTTYDVTVGVRGATYISDPDTLTGLEEGTEVTLTITPESEDYVLKQFVVNDVDESGSSALVNNDDGTYTYKFTVTAETTVEVEFAALAYYSVNLSTGANGRITTDLPDASNVLEGTIANVTVMPSSKDFDLNTFYINGTDMKEHLTKDETTGYYNYTFEVRANTTISATFVRLHTRVMELKSSVNGGTTTVEGDAVKENHGDGSYTVYVGKTVTLNTAPADGYQVSSITVNGEEKVTNMAGSSSYSFNVEAAEDTENDAGISVRVVYGVIDTENAALIKTSVLPAAGETTYGTIDPIGDVYVPADGTAVFHVIPDENCYVRYAERVYYHGGRNEWVVEQLELTQLSDGTYQYEFQSAYGQQNEFNVEFAIKTYNVSAGGTSGGAVLTSPTNLDLTAVPHGTTMTVTMVSYDDYRVENLVVNNVSLGAHKTYTFTVTSDMTIRASFVKRVTSKVITYHTIDVVANGVNDQEDTLAEYPYRYRIRAAGETLGNDEGWDGDWRSSHTYTFSELEPNKQYTIDVQAKDRVGNTAISSANIYTLANTPSTVSAEARNDTNNSIDKSVSLEIDTAGNPQNTEYRVLYSEYANMKGRQPANSTNGNDGWAVLEEDGTFLIRGLDSGKRYYLQIQARNGNGETTAIVEDDIISILLSPSAPEEMSLWFDEQAGPGGGITLHWAEVTSSEILSVEIYKDSQWLAEVPIGNTQYTDNSVLGDSVSTYSYAYVNNAGVGSKREAVSTEFYNAYQNQNTDVEKYASMVNLRTDLNDNSLYSTTLSYPVFPSGVYVHRSSALGTMDSDNDFNIGTIQVYIEADSTQAVRSQQYTVGLHAYEKNPATGEYTLVTDTTKWSPYAEENLRDTISNDNSGSFATWEDLNINYEYRVFVTEVRTTGPQIRSSNNAITDGYNGSTAGIEGSLGKQYVVNAEGYYSYFMYDSIMDLYDKKLDVVEVKWADSEIKSEDFTHKNETGKDWKVDIHDEYIDFNKSPNIDLPDTAEDIYDNVTVMTDSTDTGDGKPYILLEKGGSTQFTLNTVVWDNDGSPDEKTATVRATVGGASVTKSGITSIPVLEEDAREQENYVPLNFNLSSLGTGIYENVTLYVNDGEIPVTKTDEVKIVLNKVTPTVTVENANSTTVKMESGKTYLNKDLKINTTFAGVSPDNIRPVRLLVLRDRYDTFYGAHTYEKIAELLATPDSKAVIKSKELLGTTRYNSLADANGLLTSDEAIKAAIDAVVPEVVAYVNVNIEDEALIAQYTESGKLKVEDDLQWMEFRTAMEGGYCSWIEASTEVSGGFKVTGTVGKTYSLLIESAFGANVGSRLLTVECMEPADMGILSSKRWAWVETEKGEYDALETQGTTIKMAFDTYKVATGETSLPAEFAGQENEPAYRTITDDSGAVIGYEVFKLYDEEITTGKQLISGQVEVVTGIYDRFDAGYVMITENEDYEPNEQDIANYSQGDDQIDGGHIVRISGSSGSYLTGQHEKYNFKITGLSPKQDEYGTYYLFVAYQCTDPITGETTINFKEDSIVVFTDPDYPISYYGFKYSKLSYKEYDPNRVNDTIYADIEREGDAETTAAEVTVTAKYYKADEYGNFLNGEMTEITEADGDIYTYAKETLNFSNGLGYQDIMFNGYQANGQATNTLGQATLTILDNEYEQGHMIVRLTMEFKESTNYPYNRIMQNQKVFDIFVQDNESPITSYILGVQKELGGIYDEGEEPKYLSTVNNPSTGRVDYYEYKFEGLPIEYAEIEEREVTLTNEGTGGLTNIKATVHTEKDKNSAITEDFRVSLSTSTLVEDSKLEPNQKQKAILSMSVNEYSKISVKDGVLEGWIRITAENLEEDVWIRVEQVVGQSTLYGRIYFTPDKSSENAVTGVSTVYLYSSTAQSDVYGNFNEEPLYQTTTSERGGYFEINNILNNTTYYLVVKKEGCVPYDQSWVTRMSTNTVVQFVTGAESSMWEFNLQIKPGDVDADLDIDINDYNLFTQYYGEYYTEDSDREDLDILIRCDTNCDGYINALDRMILWSNRGNHRLNGYDYGVNYQDIPINMGTIQ